jgi:hypothetical protein
MTPDVALTLVMTRHDKPAPRVASTPRETLVLGCVICRSPHHGRIACPMADDEKTEAAR